MPQITLHCLTSKSDGILRVLTSECGICPSFDPHTLPAAEHPSYQKFNGIWDTGATGSVITQEVVDRCGLKPTGMVLSHHAAGSSMTETYQVNFQLPNSVQFVGFTVTLGVLPHGAHALIGMDIISLGDFNITNAGGKTMFSYRNPSVGGVDFVEHLNDLRRQTQRQQSAPRPPHPGSLVNPASRKGRH